MSTGGVPVRSCARVVGSADSQKLDNGSVFIAGNAMELVPSGKSDGEKHTFSRIFDVHASDKDVYESEVLPLIGGLVAGENVSLVTMGHHRGGHGQLLGVVAPLCVDAIFDQMQQRQASIGGDGTNLAFQLSVRYASIILGSDHMGDLLGSGSAELRIVRDAEAVGGVQLPGLTSQTLATPSAFHELLRKGRTRLAQQHKPPAPSSVIIVELEQTLRADGRRQTPPEVIISQLLLADIEVGVLGDGLSNALRQALHAPPTQPPAHSGAALLLRETVGGNGRTLLLGCVQPADYDESAATLQLLTHAMSVSTYPMVNGATSRGMMRRHYWHTQQLQESLAVAEQRLSRGVEQLATDRQQLPSQIFGAADRLQGIMDEMQQDQSAGAQRQALMAEVMQQRTRANQASGELVGLKEELLSEKQQKSALAKQLLSLQLGTNEASTRQAQRAFELEQQALASSDALSQLEQRGAQQHGELKQVRDEAAAAERGARRLEQQRLSLQAQLQSLQAEADEAREREDERNLQLLNASNGRTAAERKLEAVEAAAAATAGAAERAQEASERHTAALAAARASDEAAREEASLARLATEKAQLQAEQDVLAVQRMAAAAAEQAVERVRSLHTALSRTQEEARLAAAAAATREARARSELSRVSLEHGALRTALSVQDEQLEAMQRHGEALSGEQGAEPGAEPDEAAALAAAARGGGARHSEAPVAQQLHTYERQVNGVLQTNRALSEAYWRLRGIAAAASGGEGGGGSGGNAAAVALPSHEELGLLALIQPATGRREVPSELEKSLQREKAGLERQLHRAHTAADAQLQQLASSYEGHGGTVMELEKERAELRAEVSAARGREAELEAKHAELQREAEAAQSVAALKETQGELLEELDKLRAGDDAEEAAERAQLPRLREDNEKLQQQLAELAAQLASAGSGGGGGGGGAAVGPKLLNLQLQVRELVASQALLERERSQLVQRATHSEEQLAEMQKYLSANIGRYQKEILRLRDQLGKGGQAQ